MQFIMDIRRILHDRCSIRRTTGRKETNTVYLVAKIAMCLPAHDHNERPGGQKGIRDLHGVVYRPIGQMYYARLEYALPLRYKG